MKIFIRKMKKSEDLEKIFINYWMKQQVKLQKIKIKI